MSRVLVLGSTGMLGDACKRLFTHSSKHEIVCTSRNESKNSVLFDAKNDSIDNLLNQIQPDWIINCIGVIKPYINESDAASTCNAIEINSIFPHRMAKAIEGSNVKVIQIATDCVFSGQVGLYTEKSPHDALDVYGKTKSLGEVNSGSFVHIRASIIGPERGRSTSLLEWFLGQEPNSQLNGFNNHLWNGITTHHFAKLALAIIESGTFASGVKHIIPSDIVTKSELLQIFKEVYRRHDIKIHSVESSHRVDRTLSSIDLEFSNNLWNLAGYQQAPTVEQMVREQFEFNNSHK